MRTLLLAVLIATAPAPALAAQGIAIPEADRTRLAEVFRLARTLGDSVWRGWSSAPFAVLLLTPKAEFLLHHPAPGSDFTRAGHDSVLGSDVFVRAPTLPPTLLATFPAVGGINTIVVGGASETNRRSTHWVLTVLHEHFHQLQMSHPSYQGRLRVLDLARGDETGQWMLTYPFPYRSRRVQQRFAAYSAALIAALSPDRNTGPDRSVRRVLQAREALKAVLSAPEYRYLTFQMWQEGVARYIELRTARMAAAAGPASAAMRALPDFTSYTDEADALEHEIRTAGAALPLADVQRVAFYPLGAAFAMLLDRVRPTWPAGYFGVPLSLDTLLPSAAGMRR